MDIGRVVGNVVSTIRNEAMSVGDLLLIVEYEHGGREAAVDTVRSGIGDRVLITHGTAARLATGSPNSSIDAAIIALVDSLDEANDT